MSENNALDSIQNLETPSGFIRFSTYNEPFNFVNVNSIAVIFGESAEKYSLKLVDGSQLDIQGEDMGSLLSKIIDAQKAVEK